MLRFKDKTGQVKMIIRDEDTQPVDIDKLVLEDIRKKKLEKEENEEQSANGNQ